LKPKKFKKPKRLDYDLVVIGAGAAGLVSAYIGAAVKARVALIEKHKMGGDCLNTGCVPSKALIRTAQALDDIRRSGDFGIHTAHAEFDFAHVMERVQSVITRIEPHDSIERYTSLGVECFTGEAKILTPWEVRVGEKILTTRNVIVATGARPFVPPLPGLELIPHFTSDSIWSLRKKPGHLVVLGGGPIGCELAQAFRRLEVEVTLIEKSPHLLGREDDDVSDLVRRQFEKEGVRVLLSHEAKRIETAGDERFLICDSPRGETRIPADALLITLGRKPNVTGFGLEDLGIGVDGRGHIGVDEKLRTIYPNILACGDVAGPYQFTHMASHQAWYAAVNALARPFRQFKADYRVVPWCTYTDPEVARVGLNEREAKEKNVPYLASTYSLEGLDRAICDGEAQGFVRVLTRPGSDEIIGVTLVAHRAGELISEFVLAMKHGLGLNAILSTIHIYPTLTEANKFAAGAWKRQTAPQRLLKWVEKFHSLRRKLLVLS
jgi:pyruvate/2-oxoglutarate dehydrogenase complex dihydrolipoamide dehydrogenase (E3) component